MSETKVVRVSKDTVIYVPGCETCKGAEKARAAVKANLAKRKKRGRIR